MQDLLRRRSASEQCVSMRKAAEAANHLRVALRPIERSGETGFRRQCAEQGERTLLHRRILAVLERHVQKPALRWRELTIESARDRILRGGERALIAGERLGGTAKRIARELIEQDHARERAVRLVAPFAERAGAGCRDRFAE